MCRQPYPQPQPQPQPLSLPEQSLSYPFSLSLALSQPLPLPLSQPLSINTLWRMLNCSLLLPAQGQRRFRQSL